jgi:predicted transcriptional regulator of viral defense system
MNSDTIKQRIEEHIKHGHKNSVYMLTDFSGLGNYSGVKEAVSKLTAEGKLLRVKRGIYESPYYSSFLQEQVKASPLDVAKKIARKNRWTIAPSGNTALNALGLSTQVPAEYHFVSSGTTKEIELDAGIRLYFKHIPPKEIAGISAKSALIIEAVKAIGRTGMNDSLRAKIGSSLSDTEKERLARESKTSRVWVAEEIRKILAAACTK